MGGEVEPNYLKSVHIDLVKKELTLISGNTGVRLTNTPEGIVFEVFGLAPAEVTATPAQLETPQYFGRMKRHPRELAIADKEIREAAKRLDGKGLSAEDLKLVRMGLNIRFHEEDGVRFNLDGSVQ